MSAGDGVAAPGAGRRARDLLARVPLAIWPLLLLAVGLRTQLWLEYHPAALNIADTADYVYAARTELFADSTKPAGYPIFLRGAHAISEQLEFTIALQHLLGLATGLILYAAVRRLGAPLWAGALAAAAVLFSLDQVFLEHAVMGETVFTLLFAGSLYAAIRAVDPGRALAGPFTSRHAWIAAAATAMALAGWIRPVAVPVIGLLALWFALALGGTWRARLANAALAAATGAVVVLGYFAIHSASNGYFGLSEAGGWAMYSRVAPFADCSRFEPPAGTEELCEKTPEAARPGPDFYGQQPDSPARILFGAPPTGNEELGAFARRALLAQPLSYAEDVTRDFVRYFFPGFKPQDFSGVGYEVVDVDRRAAGTEEFQIEALNGYYADDRYAIEPGISTLGEIQDVLRVHPKLLLVSVLLGLAGLVLAAGRLRWGIALLLFCSLAIMAIAPATAIWSSRYAIPADGPLVACGAIGAWLIWARLQRRRTAAAPL